MLPAFNGRATLAVLAGALVGGLLAHSTTSTAAEAVAIVIAAGAWLVSGIVEAWEEAGGSGLRLERPARRDWPPMPAARRALRRLRRRGR